VNDLRIQTRFRAWALALAVFAAASTYGLIHAPAAYHAPIFDTVRAMLPLDWWAAVWAAIAVAAVAAAITRRAAAWITATTFATFAAVAWWAAVTYQAWFNGERLSWTGWALWFWFAFTNVRVGFARPFEKRPT
jgi:hypothetical protein